MRRALLAATLLAVGCGPPTYGDFLDQMTTAWCDREVRCGLRAAGEPGCAPAPAHLVARSELDRGQSIADGRMRYDALAAKACIDAVKHSVCDPTGMLLATRARCAAVVAPRVEAYGACQGHDECLGGRCVFVGDACVGQCEPYLPVGSACDTDPAACDPTVHFCDGARCVAKGGKGAACTDDLACDADFRCVDGRCASQPRPGRGQPCDALRFCNDATYCRDGSCVERGGTDAPCDRPEACKSERLCVGLLATRAGVCGPPAPLDGACVADAEITGCPPGLRCVGNQCLRAEAQQAGWNETCALYPCRSELACLSSTCVLTVGQGGGCDQAGVCQLGLACVESRCTFTACSQVP